jgi:hypothetical protein
LYTVADHIPTASLSSGSPRRKSEAWRLSAYFTKVRMIYLLA